MQAVLRSNLLHRLHSLNRFERDSGLELTAVIPSLSFHFSLGLSIPKEASLKSNYPSGSVSPYQLIGNGGANA